MALQSARQLLDELMGRQRDLDPKEKDGESANWRDPRVCKYFMVKFCPNQLFTNTKADMGPCTKLHDEYIKKVFDEKASKKEKMMFEEEFIKFCQQMLNDVERRIKRAKQRLAASQAEKTGPGAAAGPILNEDVQEKMDAISDEIETLLSEAEKLGCEGNVDDSQEILKQVEKLKEDKAQLKRDNMPMHWIQQRAEIGAAQEKQMEVCDVCGAFLIVNDVQQRVDDHLQGKQHQGFGKLKTTMDDILQRRKREAMLNGMANDIAEIDNGNCHSNRKRSRSKSVEKQRSSHRDKERSVSSRDDGPRDRNKNRRRTSSPSDYDRHHKSSRPRSRSKDRRSSTHVSSSKYDRSSNRSSNSSNSSKSKRE